MAGLEFIVPDWPVPPNVHAAVTTRTGGISKGPFTSLNLAMHVGDEPDAVAENRRRLRDSLALPAEPAWLTQVHGRDVAVLPQASDTVADAAVAFAPGSVCATLVADCLPVLLASRDGDRVAVAHAGWRGLAAGVVEATVAALRCDPARLVAWLGPVIGAAAFEVGAEVEDALTAGMPDASRHFRPGRADRRLADLPALARQRLVMAGVTGVFGGTLCTHTDGARFYSFRRDGRTGRIAALCWLD